MQNLQLQFDFAMLYSGITKYKNFQDTIRVATERYAAKMAERERTMKTVTMNHTDNTIEVSSAFYKKACKYGTPEYKILREAKKDEPDFTVTIKQTTKKTYNKLTFEAMIAHIKLIETVEEERNKVLKEFEEVKTYSAARGSSYPTVKKWFLAKYKKSYNNAFNIEPTEAGTNDPKEEKEIA